MTMANTERAYLPAAGHDWFLPLYDPLTRLLGADEARRILLDQAALQDATRVLDVGCGTGTLAVLISRQYPEVQVVGLDPDAKALARAVGKARRARAPIQFDQGFADALPYPDGWFDRVLSSMMFHHVAFQDRPAVLREILRVLRPGGRLEMLDFAGPQENGGFIARMVHSHHQLKDNAEHKILSLMTDTGFREVRLVQQRGFLFGRVAYYQATRTQTRLQLSAHGLQH